MQSVTISRYRNHDDPAHSYIVRCRRCDLRWTVCSRTEAEHRKDQHHTRHDEIDGLRTPRRYAASIHAAEDMAANVTEMFAGPTRRAIWRLRDYIY